MSPFLPLLLVLAAEPARGPVLVAEPASHDFGIINSVPQVWQWKVRNDGDQPLTITAPGCECARIGFKLPDAAIAPGESGAVAFTLTLEPTRYGEGLKSVNIQTSDPAHPHVTLSAKWNYEPPVICSPPGIRFGDVPVGAGAEAFITVLSLDPSFTIDALKSTSPHVTFEPVAGDDPSTRARYPGIRVFRALLSPDIPTGLLDAKLIVDARAAVSPGAEPVAFTYDATLTANVRTGLALSPGTFRPAPSAPGAPFETALTLSSRSGAAFKVLSVSLTDASLPGAGVESRVEPDPAGGWRITLTGSAPAEPGLHRATVEITTDAPHEPPLTVPLQIMVRRGAP